MSRHRRYPTMLAALAVALTLAMVLVGCGGGGADEDGVASLGKDGTSAGDDSDGGGKKTEAEREEALLAFTKCMREHGVDMPDPSGDDGGGVARLDADVDRATLDKAQEACRKHIEGIQPDLSPEQQQEAEDQMVKFARCMREHGIDMPDPDFSGGDGTVTVEEIDLESPEFKAAQEACRKYQPKPPGGDSGMDFENGGGS